MGSTGSRSRLSQVAPCHSQTEGDLDQQASHPTSHWTIPAIPTPLEHQHEPLGHRRTTQLPPLKLENPATFPPLSTASHKVKSTFGVQASFILSHHGDYRAGTGEMGVSSTFLHPARGHTVAPAACRREVSWRHRWSSVNRPSRDREPTRDKSENSGSTRGSSIQIILEHQAAKGYMVDRL
ncbi:uncharacterized protein LOC118941476 isoform X4 [Oncorhynchus mykiss]|uniref:uncharacterized protein LOC118941476 isoform X4 n=1 Tax=Oncorhynchus mykiss TaxID=8022 RepID=UPI001877FC7C|nr:uncharacterized protein LOC118941476 isoform X4 [Oncorhynchus mykiss]